MPAYRHRHTRRQVAATRICAELAQKRNPGTKPGVTIGRRSYGAGTFTRRPTAEHSNTLLSGARSANERIILSRWPAST